MKKLNYLSNYHLWIGIVTILLQIVFSISIWLFPIGLATIVLSRYEKWIVRGIKKGAEQSEINRIFQNFKMINMIAFVILGVIFFNIIAEVLGERNVLDLIKNDPLLYINWITILSVLTIFMGNREIEKMKLAIK